MDDSDLSDAAVEVELTGPDNRGGGFYRYERYRVRLDGAASLSRPEVQELLDAAEAQADPGFLKTGGGKLIIRSVSEKQRPRQ